MDTKPPLLRSAWWTQPPEGLVELSGDWTGTAGLPGVFCASARKSVFAPRPRFAWAAESGYERDGSLLWFHLPRKRLEAGGVKPGESVYVAGDFNGWQEAVGKEEWRLTGDTGGGLSLPKPWTEFAGRSWEFKFVTGSGRWLEAPNTAPNISVSSYGTRNRLLDPGRTGYHLWQFRLEGISPPYWGRHQFEYEGVRLNILPGPDFLESQTGATPGVTLTEKTTEFRLFAPRAETVKVVLHPPGQPELARPHTLTQTPDGLWFASFSKRMDHWRYHYLVQASATDPFSHFQGEFPILDPYALAADGPAGPGVIVPPSAWESVPSPDFRPPCWHDLVIAEAHLGDMTLLAPGMTEAEKFGYEGFARWLRRPDNPLKSLGVNTIEFQPVCEVGDHYDKRPYHWGYMPVNWFAPDSAHATDPAGASQVGEFREMVAACHEAGFAVILDVVYNHVGEPNHLLHLDKLYYFDTAPDGSLMNWSGCGNTYRPDTPMGRRLIRDSLVHFLTAYKVDGFRFDLAELIGLETLRYLEGELKKVNPAVILIAEPWSFRGHFGEGIKSTGFAFWNDGFREFWPRYLRGGDGPDALYHFLEGSLGGHAAFPAQSVNYTESHDDRVWLDKITENPDHNGTRPTARDRRRTHLMLAGLFSSLGIPMIHAGQDFLGTKNGVENTYRDAARNALDPLRRAEFASTHDYAAAWVRLRLSDLGRVWRLQHRPGSGYARHLPGENSSAALVWNADCSLSGVSRLLFAINPREEPARVHVPGLDRAHWCQIADHERVAPYGLGGALIPWDERGLLLPPLSCGLWVELD